MLIGNQKGIKSVENTYIFSFLAKEKNNISFPFSFGSNFWNESYEEEDPGC